MQSIVPVAAAVLPMLVLLVSCGTRTNDAADSAADSSTSIWRQCPASAAAYCASSPTACPRGPDQMCEFLRASDAGPAVYGGPVSCDGVGGGYHVRGVWFLWDDAGVAAVIERGGEGGLRCLGGPADSNAATSCRQHHVAFSCDAGPD